MDTFKIRAGDTCTHPAGYTGRHFITPSSAQYDATDPHLIGQYSPELGVYYNDRRGYDGKPYTGCPSVYHTCANVVINGQQPRKGLQCSQVCHGDVTPTLTPALARPSTFDLGPPSTSALDLGP